MIYKNDLEENIKYIFLRLNDMKYFDNVQMAKVFAMSTEIEKIVRSLKSSK